MREQLKLRRFVAPGGDIRSDRAGRYMVSRNEHSVTFFGGLIAYRELCIEVQLDLGCLPVAFIAFVVRMKWTLMCGGTTRRWICMWRVLM